MRGFRIGRIFGIDLRVDYSWVFIFVLLTWNLVSVFSGWHPAWSPFGAFVVAAIASLSFFCCVLLHELAHSLVARTYGLRVRSITLFLFGGVSNLEQEPRSARAEFFMAIAGPIASIALGAAFLLVASAVATVSVADAGDIPSTMARLGPLTTLLVWLGPINIIIGFFNLVPGFPLDGGRVLRSILWKITGDLRSATRWASGAGQTIGWLFIGAGIAMTFGARLPFFGTGLISGLWLAFIGWFLHSAATQAAGRLALEEALTGMTVGQLMQRQGPVGTPDLSVAALVNEHLIPGDDRALPIVGDEGALLGLVSISDLRTLHSEQWARTPVGSIMRHVEALSVATPDEPLVKAFEELAKQDIAQLPVVVNGKLVGVLRRRDVTRWLELAWRPTTAGGGPSARKPATPAAGVREADAHAAAGRQARHAA